MGQKIEKSYRILCDLPRYLLAILCRRKGYDDIAACVTYRRGLQLLTPFSDESGVTPHVIGMLLTIEAHVVSARSVLFLLMRIGIAEVIRVLSSPLLIRFLLLPTTTLGPTTGLLPLLEPRVRVIPATTERTPPPREHTFLLQRTSSGQID
jgi:hypothetical protein